MSFVEEKLLPQVLRVHDTVYRKTNGWIGHRTLWIPSLLLHRRRKDRQTAHHVADLRPRRRELSGGRVQGRRA